ncbi:nucleoside hydrolase [Yoonia sp. MH D7]
MKMIIDTDPGIDDAMAIALAHAMPEVELIGLTACFGNTFVAQSSRNARYLCDLMGFAVPVAQGAALPYDETHYTPSANVHGPEGLGDLSVVPEIGENTPENAAQFLVDMARKHKGELVVCAVAPLTNIADALKLDPEFATNIKELVIMGGAFHVAGNITPHAEANIYHDAKAADAVFASTMPIKMIGLDATLLTLLSPEDFDVLRKKAPKIGGFIAHISDFYLEFYRSVGITNGCPMHDATAVLACTHPEKFTFEESGLRVILKGADMGKTVADPTRRPVEVAINVAGEWAVDLFMERVISLG